MLTLHGKNGWREVEIGRGSSDSTCPVVALETWLTLGRIAHGPLFRRVTGGGKTVGPQRLLDQQVARLVKRTAVAAGVRGDLSEAERAGLLGTRFGPAPRRLPKSTSVMYNSSSGMHQLR